jgi:hypothetical protein
VKIRPYTALFNDSTVRIVFELVRSNSGAGIYDHQADMFTKLRARPTKCPISKLILRILITSENIEYVKVFQLVLFKKD